MSPAVVQALTAICAELERLLASRQAQDKGTSEGARKGWEKRARGTGPDAPAGRGSSAMSGLYDRVSQPDGGFTYQPLTANEPKAGYAVSPYQDRSFAKPVGQFTARDVAAFARKNRDLFAHPDHYMGAWHDPASGMVFLDVSVVSSDPKQAEQLAQQHDQIAYFDLAKGQSVTVNPNATSGGVHNA